MSKKRRYPISAAVLAACVGLAWAVVAMLPPGHGVTKANFDRIEVGVTETEAVAILGRSWRQTRIGSGRRFLALPL